MNISTPEVVRVDGWARSEEDVLQLLNEAFSRNSFSCMTHNLRIPRRWGGTTWFFAEKAFQEAEPINGLTPEKLAKELLALAASPTTIPRGAARGRGLPKWGIATGTYEGVPVLIAEWSHHHQLTAEKVQ